MISLSLWERAGGEGLAREIFSYLMCVDRDTIRKNGARR